jgi:hypothetical protein
VKPSPTRTINPLHFEDLEPHRFEDLVRQLAYGFRRWVVLEPLGRSGADEGIDIRGIEVVGGQSIVDDPDQRFDGDTEVEDVEREERVWFLQCKREKTFGPAKAKSVAEAALEGAVDPPYGFILAAPCELSKRTRDTLATELRERGVHQVIAWGKADLEDLLFRPENDHLLFAYFGLSLRVRQRKRTTELRGRLAKKRQIHRAVGGLDHRGWTPVLVRDPDEPGYPFVDRVEELDPRNPPWLWTAFRDHSNPETLPLIFRRFHAWVSKDRKRFDVVDACSHVVPHRHGFEKVPPRDEELCERLWRFFHNEIPEDERAWLEVVGWIRYDDILLVDDLGDAFNEPPHLLVQRQHKHGFFAHQRSFLQLDRVQDAEPLDPDRLKRTALFPDPIPDVEWKRFGS